MQIEYYSVIIRRNGLSLAKKEIHYEFGAFNYFSL